MALCCVSLVTSLARNTTFVTTGVGKFPSSLELGSDPTLSSPLSSFEGEIIKWPRSPCPSYSQTGGDTSESSWQTWLYLFCDCRSGICSTWLGVQHMATGKSCFGVLKGNVHICVELLHLCDTSSAVVSRAVLLLLLLPSSSFGQHGPKEGHRAY